MPFLTDLDEVLRERGVQVVETAGWKTRGYNGWSLTAVRGTLWHHTATHRSRFAGNPAPTLEMCMYGRPGLAGPLCQIVLGRDGKAYLTAAGWGNHAGTGSAPGIPRDQGNAYLIGVEMESSGIAPADWTPEQLAAIPVLRDALRDGYGHKLDIAHFEYSDGGKIDPWGLPGGMNWLRTAPATKVSAASAPAKDWFDTLDETTLRRIIRQETVGYRNEKLEKRDLYGIVRDIPKDVVRELLNYDNTTRTDRTIYSLIVDAGLNSHEANATAKTILATVKAQEAVLAALASDKGLDPAEIQATVDGAVRDALSGFSLTLQAAPVEETVPEAPTPAPIPE